MDLHTKSSISFVSFVVFILSRVEKATTACFTTGQVAEDISSHVQLDYDSDSEEEGQDVSEEDDVEEYNPEHEEDDEEEQQQVRETFLLKDGNIEWSSVSYNKHGRTAEWNLRLMTTTMKPGPTPYAVSHARNIA